MGIIEELEWIRLGGKNPSGSNRSKQILGTEMIVKTSDGWQRSRYVGLRTFAKKETNEKDNARGYNTLSYDDAVFGAILILIMLFAPYGILSLNIRGWWKRMTAREKTVVKEEG